MTDPSPRTVVTLDSELVERLEKHLGLTKPRWERILSSPVASVTLGFVLAAVAGYTSSCQNIAEKNAERALAEEANRHAAAAAAAKDLATALAARTTRLGFLLMSIAREGVPLAELRDTKRLYDEAVISYDAQLYGTDIALRRALQASEAYDSLRVSFHELNQTLSTIDLFTAQLYESRLAAPQTGTYDIQHINASLLPVQACMELITVDLFEVVGTLGSAPAARAPPDSTKLNERHKNCRLG